MKGSIIWRSGKSKKSGGIGTHVTAITKRKFMPNLQRVRVQVGAAVKRLNVCTRCIRTGKIKKAAR